MPPNRENCAAIIPCLNEAAQILGIVGGIRALLPSVFVVDDGSTDGTSSEAEAGGAEVLRHPRPAGKGAALSTGWAAAAARGFTWTLMFDGDGQHAAGDIPGLLAAASDDVRLVVGNRFANPGRMPWLRRRVNVWMSRRLTHLAGVALPDSQCGLRIAHLPTLLSLGLRARHFEIESEMCVAFARAGHQIAFVPVHSHYGAERSKIAPLRDAWRWLTWRRRTLRALR